MPVVCTVPGIKDGIIMILTAVAWQWQKH